MEPCDGEQNVADMEEVNWFRSLTMVEQSVLFSGHDHLNVLLCLFAQIEGQFVHIYKTTTT
jgi:hypothetical protein